MALLIGVAVGIIVGALGAGGGIVSVPVLVYLLHVSPHDATAASLIIVGVTAVVSLFGRRRDVHVRDGLIFGGLSVVGSVLGGLASGLVSSVILMALFAVLLLVVALVMARRAVRERRAGQGPGRASDTSRAATRAQRGLLLLLASASATGFLTGFFGVGGGFAVVPILVLVLGFGMKEASATSLLVMVIASVAGLASRLGSDVSFDWPLIALFTVGSSLGGLLGGPITKRVSGATLTMAFAIFLAVVAIGTGLQAIPALVESL